VILDGKEDDMVAKKDELSIEQALEAAARKAGKEKYVLRLYVAGISPRSSEAIRKVTALCENHLIGRYDLEIIDIHQQPALAKDAQIIAAPTLIKKLPLPLRRLIGSMADEEKILVGLELRPKKAAGD
jgi:circadian clock protein KaiB